MFRTVVAFCLFVATSAGFAAAARAQYNDPSNQYNLQRQEGGAFLLPAPQDSPQPQYAPKPQDNNPSQGYQINQGYQGGQQGGYQGLQSRCPSCRADISAGGNLIPARTVALQGYPEELSVPTGRHLIRPRTAA